MSDKSKRDRELQRRVRMRQDKTGESYQAAWRALQAAEDGTERRSITLSDGRPAVLVRIAGAGDASEEVEASEVGTRDGRRVLPLMMPASSVDPPSRSAIPPNRPTRVSMTAGEAINIERVYIADANSWVVNAIEIDGRSQLPMKDVAGALFSNGGLSSGKRAPGATLSLHFDTLERGQTFAIVVTYVGEDPNGAPFHGAAIGQGPPQRPTVIPIVSSILRQFEKTTISARIKNASFRTDRILVDPEGISADWVMNDIRVNGETRFAQAGDIPCDIFITNAIDMFIDLKQCDAGDMVEFDVTYIGLEKPGKRFVVHLEGVVIRDDHSVAPPDLNVLVKTADAPAESVIGTCNWRD